jgi:hypothetical protein
MQTKDSKLGVHVGVFAGMTQADRAVGELLKAGFSKEQITVIAPSAPAEKYQDFHKRDPSGSHATVGAATGGAIGLVLGGLLAASIVASSGGVGLVVIGPLLSASGAGALSGGFVGAMMSRGFDREVADFYDQALEKGQILVSVESGTGVSPADLKAADDIFVTAGAEQVTLQKT